MILNITSPNGGVRVVESERIWQIEFNPDLSNPIIVHSTSSGEFRITPEQLSELADQGLKLANLAMASYIAFKMTHPGFFDDQKIAGRRMKEKYQDMAQSNSGFASVLGIKP